jgi:hypothetical protein
MVACLSRRHQRWRKLWVSQLPRPPVVLEGADGLSGGSTVESGDELPCNARGHREVANALEHLLVEPMDAGSETTTVR